MRKITFSLMLLASAQAGAAVNQWTRTQVQGVTEYRIQGKDGAELLLTCSPDDNAFVQYTAPDGKKLTSGNDDGRSVQAQVDSGDTFLINDTLSDAGGVNSKPSGTLPVSHTGLISPRPASPQPLSPSAMLPGPCLRLINQAV